MGMYPVIVSKNDLNTPLAYLNNIQNDNCTISKSINGEDTLEFTAIIEELKTDFLYDENNLILVDDDLYKPLVLEEEHHDNGLLTIHVECEHISYELLDKIMQSFVYTDKDIVTVITACLLGTDFILAGTDVTNSASINFDEECNGREVLMTIAANWKAELKFNKYNIYAYNMIGSNRGVDFRFGKNLKSIRRTIDRSERDENGNPYVSYDVDIVNLVLLNNEYSQLEYFELGDTVRIVDSALGITTYQRIVALDKDVLTGKNTNLVLGAPREDMRQTVTGMQTHINGIGISVDELGNDVSGLGNDLGELGNSVSDLENTVNSNAPDWDKIKDITDNLGNVIAAKIAGTLKLAATQIENSTTTMEITDNGILFHNQPTEAASTFACLLNSTGILFANSKDSRGNWEWQTAINADGVTATKILASALYGLTVEAVTITGGTITGGTITGGTINGVTMEGSTIYAGDRKNGNYVEISNIGAIYGYRENKEIFNLETNNKEGRFELYDSTSSGDYIKIHSATNMNTGSYEELGSAVETNREILFIGGPGCHEVYFNLRGYPAMAVRDGSVTIYGDLTVTGKINN